MPNIFIILGGRNTRKSSTIRALTGVSRENIYQVAIQRGIIDVFVKISSLQESKISPEDFISEVNQNRYQNVLVSLWIARSGQQPDGNVYIQNFLRTGWNIREIVVLGRDSLPYNNLPQGLPEPRFILNSREMPVNQIASQIRERWQWL